VTDEETSARPKAEEVTSAELITDEETSLEPTMDAKTSAE
jgi:hypothetical protein